MGAPEVGMPVVAGPAPDPQPWREESDPLSDVLEAVRLAGAVFFLVDARAPWVAEVPASIAKWNKTTIDGVRVESNGLKNRRAAEVALWNTA